MDKIIQNVFRFQINHGIVRAGGIFNMKNIYLLKYSVKGIKTLDELVSLSFYKKIIPKNPDTQEYNIKAIYGMNGTGKSAIVCSVEILKNLLVNEEYLTNPLVQKKLGELINKKTNELFIQKWKSSYAFCAFRLFWKYGSRLLLRHCVRNGPFVNL